MSAKMQKARLQDVSWDKKTQGMLRVFVAPKAYLHVDGRRMLDPKGKPRRSDRFAVALTAGKHEISMVKEGYETAKTIVEVKAGLPDSLNFVLLSSKINRNTMVKIPGGYFKMGLSKGDLRFIVNRIGGKKRYHRIEYPRHTVKVSTFYIDKYEVTNAQYKKFVEATDRKSLPRNWKNGTYPRGKGNYPVTNVTWHDASDYAKWAGKRLPTESEWEKAARWSISRSRGRRISRKKFPDKKLIGRLLKAKIIRKNRKRPKTVNFVDRNVKTIKQLKYQLKSNGIKDMEPVVALWRYAHGTAYLYSWGDTYKRNFANLAEADQGKTVITGLYSAGKAYYGAVDMVGNVREWTASRYKDYPKNKFKNEFTNGTDIRVARGGSFRDGFIESLTTCRFVLNEVDADDDLGFRCAKSAKLN
ncbi:MAG: formylglycine-generating enzyme family protein [bacterium]